MNAVTKTEGGGAALKPIDEIRHTIDIMTPQFEMVLPQHIPVDRFKRIAITAINRNPDLLAADKRTLFAACMLAAQDGLLPDGREGALVIFNTKGKDAAGRDIWVKAVQWMPMIYGITKKLRQSGEVAEFRSRVVYANDRFEFICGDEEKIVHVPTLEDDQGKMVAVYAIAKLTDGSVEREVMPKATVDKIRAASKSASGPAWNNWYDEMARKSVARRLAKRLPMSTEVEKVLMRDDAAMVTAGGRTPVGLLAGKQAMLDAEAMDQIEAQSQTVDQLPAESGQTSRLQRFETEHGGDGEDDEQQANAVYRVLLADGRNPDFEDPQDAAKALTASAGVLLKMGDVQAFDAWRAANTDVIRQINEIKAGRGAPAFVKKMNEDLNAIISERQKAAPAKTWPLHRPWGDSTNFASAEDLDRGMRDAITARGLKGKEVNDFLAANNEGLQRMRDEQSDTYDGFMEWIGTRG